MRRALSESDLRPLPSRAEELLLRLDAPPRLAAHLRAVHDVAWQLADWFTDRLPLDRPAVLFGAATHDIGKIIHVEELSGPGHQHEPAGRDLLLANGIEPELARFAASHASWTAPGITAEELVVSLADKIWKDNPRESRSPAHRMHEFGRTELRGSDLPETYIRCVPERDSRRVVRATRWSGGVGGSRPAARTPAPTRPAARAAESATRAR